MKAERLKKLKAPKPPKPEKTARRRLSLARLRGQPRDPNDFVLPQYQQPRSPVLWIVLAAVTAAVAFGYGFGFSMFAPARIVQFGFPLLFLMGVCIWALPELGRAPTSAMERVFFIFFVSLPLWPNYLAVALPGLPWITVMRILGFPLVFLLLLGVSISKTFRDELGGTLKTTSSLWKLLVAFATIQVVSVVFSNQPQLSLNKLLIAQVNWTAMFFVAAYVFRKPGRLEAWVFLLCIIAVFISLLGMREYDNQRVLWAGHIPGFLAVDDPSVQRAMAGVARAGTDRYRVQGTFSGSLGLGEFLALTTPFLLHYIFGSYRLAVRLLAMVAVPIVLTGIILTDTRLGFVGFLLSCVMYVFFWGALRWRNHRQSIIGPALVLSFPALMVMFMLAILFVPRLRVMTIGGGRHAASTDAREAQVEAGIPMVFKHPWGFGIGRGADALGFTNGAGVMTIDTYYLLVALDYGVIGFLVFYGMLLTAIGHGFMGVVAGTRTREQTLLIPLCISLFVFFVIKSIYSGVENQSWVYMMLGAVAALVWRVRKDLPPKAKRARTHA